MDIQSLINDYTNWLKSEITFSQIGEYYEITTPFLDPSNDYLQIYVKQEGKEIHFSDEQNIGAKPLRFQSFAGSWQFNWVDISGKKFSAWHQTFKHFQTVTAITQRGIHSCLSRNNLEEIHYFVDTN